MYLNETLLSFPVFLYVCEQQLYVSSVMGVTHLALHRCDVYGEAVLTAAWPETLTVPGMESLLSLLSKPKKVRAACV